MTKRREQLKQKVQTQLKYVKEFFQRDTNKDHVHYVDTLIKPSMYVGAGVLAILLYVDYLKTDHFEQFGEFVNKLTQNDM